MESSGCSDDGMSRRFGLPLSTSSLIQPLLSMTGSTLASAYSRVSVQQFGDNHGAADDMDGGEMQDQQQKQSKRKRKAMAKEVRDRLCNSSSDALTIAYARQLFGASAEKTPTF